MSQTGPAMECEDNRNPSLRLDRLLVYLRFARTRNAARQMIEARAMRLNRKRVERQSQIVSVGDVLTLAIGNEIKVIQITAIPQKRGSAPCAKRHFRELEGPRNAPNLDPGA